MNDSGAEIQQEQIETSPVNDTNEVEPGKAETSLEYFPVSEGKLITLYIVSFGLYGIYWFYKNWKLQQPKIDKNIYPLMRAIFYIFFTHSLFNRISSSAAHLEQKHRFNANLLATLFIIAFVAGNLIDRISMHTILLQDFSQTTIIITSLIIFLLSAYPLTVVQATVNRINNDMLGYLNHRYSLWNYLLISLGALAWIMLALGILADAMGLVPAE